MMKVLPRIEGDIDKLQSRESLDKSLLDDLSEVLQIQLKDIWEGENRPDILRENLDESILNISCRSKHKIKSMQLLLENGFTSFWP